MKVENWKIEEMTREDATYIASWQYPAPYLMYSFTQEAIDEFLAEAYYSVKDTSTRKIIGYFCLGNGGRVPGGYSIGIYDDTSIIDIGLGLHPDFTNKGLGVSFVKLILHFVKEKQSLQPYN